MQYSTHTFGTTGLYTHYNTHTHYMYTQVECRGFESHPRQLIFLRDNDCLGCAVLLCYVVCLILLASFFLPSASPIKIYEHVHVYGHTPHQIGSGCIRYHVTMACACARVHARVRMHACVCVCVCVCVCRFIG